MSGRIGCPFGTNVCRAGDGSSSFCDLEAFHPSRLRGLLDVASFLVRSGNSLSASTVTCALVAVRDPMFFGSNLAVGPRQGSSLDFPLPPAPCLSSCRLSGWAPLCRGPACSASLVLVGPCCGPAGVPLEDPRSHSGVRRVCSGVVFRVPLSSSGFPDRERKGPSWFAPGGRAGLIRRFLASPSLKGLARCHWPLPGSSPVVWFPALSGPCLRWVSLGPSLGSSGWWALRLRPERTLYTGVHRPWRASYVLVCTPSPACG